MTPAVLFQEWGDAGGEGGLGIPLWHRAGSAAGLTVLCRAVPDPAFVRAQLIPDSSERNDDKLYFFFREKSADAPLSPGVYSRIGRICLVGGAAGRQGAGRGSGRAEPGVPLLQNDDGGHCCLVNKWSTFLKARLVCSVPGPDGIETHFDELREWARGGLGAFCTPAGLGGTLRRAGHPLAAPHVLILLHGAALPPALASLGMSGVLHPPC